MHGEGKKMKGSRVKGRSGLEKILVFYALLAKCFSLRLRLVRRRGVQRYAPTSVTLLTVLIIHLFDVKTVFVAFLRVSHRAFWPKRFLC